MFVSELYFFLFRSFSNYSTVTTTDKLFIIHYLSFSQINFILIVNPSFSSSFPKVQRELTFLKGD